MKVLYMFFLFILSINLFSNELDKNEIKNIDELNFYGISIKTTEYNINEKELSNKFNIAYSPFLPAGAIYSIKDVVSGKEAIIQVGTTKVNKSIYAIYLPDTLFNFFNSYYENKKSQIDLKIKFLAWNTNGKDSFYLNLQSLIVSPDKSFGQITENGLEKYYIQMGAFSHYQNSYPIIIKMIPFLKIIPHFYLIEDKVNGSGEIFKILAGPYSLETAREIIIEINNSTKYNTYIHSGEEIINKYDID